MEVISRGILEWATETISLERPFLEEEDPKGAQEMQLTMSMADRVISAIVFLAMGCRVIDLLPLCVLLFFVLIIIITKTYRKDSKMLEI